VVVKGSYVEMYSEQRVSFCLQNCKYNLLLYIIGKHNSDFDNFISYENVVMAKLLSKF